MEKTKRKKQQTNINGFPVEIVTFLDEKGESYFAIFEGLSKKGSTVDSLDLLRAVQGEFGKFKKAAVQKEDSHLILFDERGNELHLTGCTCGYPGTGAHGTWKALNALGFDINRRFVFSATSFVLNHPSICEYYRLDLEHPTPKA